MVDAGIALVAVAAIAFVVPSGTPLAVAAVFLAAVLLFASIALSRMVR